MGLLSSAFLVGKETTHPRDSFFGFKKKLPYKTSNHAPNPDHNSFGFLNRRLVSHGRDRLERRRLEREGVRLPRHGGQPLELNGLALGLGLLSELLVVLYSAEETLSRAGGLDVLDTDVEALLHVSVLDLLVDDDADGRLGNVVDDASLTVIDLVGETSVAALVKQRHFH